MPAISMTQLCSYDLNDAKKSIPDMTAGELQESLRYYEGFFKENFATPQRKYEVYMSGIRDELVQTLVTKDIDSEFPVLEEGNLIQAQIVNLISANPTMDKKERAELDYLMQLQNSANPHLAPSKNAEAPTLSDLQIRYFVGEAVKNMYHCIATYEAHIPSNKASALLTKNRERVARYRATMVTQDLKKFFTNYPFDSILAVRTEFSVPLRRTLYDYAEGDNICSKENMIKKLSNLEYTLINGDMNGKKEQPLSAYKFLLILFRSIEADLVNTLEWDNRRRNMR